jgi:hypothetical protein
MCIDILGKTEDGRLLHQTRAEINRHGHNGDGQWLKLIETGVNGWLTPAGDALLRVFHRHVMAGDWDYSIKQFCEQFKGEIDAESAVMA